MHLIHNISCLHKTTGLLTTRRITRVVKSLISKTKVLFFSYWLIECKIKKNFLFFYSFEYKWLIQFSSLRFINKCYWLLYMNKVLFNLNFIDWYSKKSKIKTNGISQKKNSSQVTVYFSVKKSSKFIYHNDWMVIKEKL